MCGWRTEPRDLIGNILAAIGRMLSGLILPSRNDVRTQEWTRRTVNGNLRKQEVYISPGGYRGTPGGTMSIGWLLDNSPQNVDQFLTGASYSGSVIVPCEGNLGVGGGVTYSSGQFSPQLSAGTTGATFSATWGLKRKFRVS